MQSKQFNTRLKIFEKYSENYNRIYFSQKWDYLGNVEPISFEFVVCPLCLEVFKKNNIHSSAPNPLTLEDIPPASLGGKKLILTCKKCNNKNGSIIDRELKDFVDMSLAPKGGISLKTKVSVDGENSFKASFEYVPEEKKIKITTGGKNPYANQQLDKIQKNWDGLETTFSFKSPKNNTVYLAFLRFAYLYSFYYFGHVYIFSDGGKYILDKINSEHIEGIDDLKIALISEEGIFSKDGMFRILVNKKYEAILVVFKMGKKKQKYYGVILPGPTKHDIVNYEEILKIEKPTFQFIEWPQRDIVNYPIEFYESW